MKKLVSLFVASGLSMGVFAQTTINRDHEIEQLVREV
jgi:hypothetical protein